MKSRKRRLSDAGEATTTSCKSARDVSPSSAALSPTRNGANPTLGSSVTSGDGQVASKPARDVISIVSDEVLIRVLSYLSAHELLLISTTSKRLYRLTQDTQLWRPHFYNRFVLPRAHLIPGFRTASERRRDYKLHFSGTKSVWADGGHGRRGGVIETSSKTNGSPSKTPPTQTAETVDWRQAYRLRHNWEKGRCAVEELPLYDMQQAASDRKTFARFVDGFAVTVDAYWGIRVWELRTRSLLAHKGFGELESRDETTNKPVCLAVDGARLDAGTLDISVGFEGGSFGVWTVDMTDKQLRLLRQHQEPDLGGLLSIAYLHPYIMTATDRGFILLYTFEYADSPNGNDRSTLPTPHLLNSLKSRDTRPARALSIRKTASSVVASFAWTFSTVGGWCIAVQDLDIRHSGLATPDIITSRVATTLPTPPPRRYPEGSPLRLWWPRNEYNDNDSDEDDLYSGPTRLCYSHPYLLATMPDNTLILHLCTATDNTLTISSGTRLYGHTSGISDAVITPGGKAVSVSSRGDEVRLWELEGGRAKDSVAVRPYSQQGNSNSGLLGDLGERKNWVGFDEEMVIVLKEKTDGRESFMVYDFT